MDPEAIGALKTLTDATRLRIVGRLATSPASIDDLARDLALPLSVVVRQLGLLRRFGIVGPPGRAPALAYELRLDTLQTLGRALDQLERTNPEPELELGPTLGREEAKILRGYLEDGRLTTIPAQEKKRQVVVRWLCDQVFTEERGYPEKEVNQRLALFHPDVASLRRYMVDAGMVTRAGGIYRRADRLPEVERPLDRSGV